MNQPASFLRGFTLTATLAGILACALGLMVLIGWFTDSALLVRLHTRFPAMQFNTALCLLCLGVAVLSLAWQRRRLAMVSIAPLGFGLLALAQGLFEVDLGIDQLLFRPPATVRYPGRMAPSAGFCTALLSFGLLTLAGSGRSPRLGMLLVLFGSIVGALAATVVFTNVTGVEINRGPMLGMAPLTAIGLGAVSLGLVALAWRDTAEPCPGLPAWLPIPVGVAALTVTLVLWQALRYQEQVQAQRATGTAASQVAGDIRPRLSYRIMQLHNLARRWQRAGRWPRLRAELESEVPEACDRGLQSVEWVGPQQQTRWITPQEGNETTVLDPVSQARRREALEAARDHGRYRATFSRPLVLAADTRGFLACIPVFDRDKHQGWWVFAFRGQELIDSLLDSRLAAGFGIMITNGDEEIGTRSTSGPWTGMAPSKDRTVQLEGTAWTVRVWPEPAKATGFRSSLPSLTLAAGSMMSLLLMLAINLAQTARRRAAETEHACRELRHEMAERERTEQVLRQTEEQLRQSQKLEAVGQLAAGVAHEFNNLLTVVLGYSELLLDTTPPTHPSHSALEEIRHAADRGSTLTRQLLAFSRKQVLMPRRIDLNTIVNNVHKMVARLLGENVSLELRLRPDLAPVQADEGQIEQVLLNLVVNARDAMPSGGQVVIETSHVERDTPHPEAAAGPYVLLSVRDTGCGMDERTRARIFEPFFTTKEVGKGTGLGLSMVYGTILQSGGHIEVFTAPGQGSTFRIFLPRLPEPAASPEVLASPPRPARGGKEKILLVEDEEMVRQTLRRVLEEHGYHVREAADGREAILSCEEQAGSIELLVTDLLMPGMNGHELAQRLVPRFPRMKVLYITGHDGDLLGRYGLSDSISHLLRKPFTPETLVCKVREVLDRYPLP